MKRVFEAVTVGDGDLAVAKPAVSPDPAVAAAPTAT